MFGRDRLQKIRDEAHQLAECGGVTNINWQRAYAQLADAADRLDAMVARTEERVDE